MNRTRTGLALLALLSLADVPTPLVTDGDQPPMGVALVASALGLASLALVWYAARGSRRAVTPLVVLRIISALTSVPALFVDDVSGGVRALVVVFLALTAVGVALVLAPARARVARKGDAQTEVAR
jgi:hypothetical protein